MKNNKLKTGTLCLITGILACLFIAVVSIDLMLIRFYRDQQRFMQSAANATPVPILTATPTPIPTPRPTPEPTPTRAPLPGDIPGVNFPEYDTGEGAEYSYQSNELHTPQEV